MLGAAAARDLRESLGEITMTFKERMHVAQFKLQDFAGPRGRHRRGAPRVG
jgi:hypothetical protein